MGAPVWASILLRPQDTCDHVDPSATQHVGVVHTLTHRGARKNHHRSGNTGAQYHERRWHLRGRASATRMGGMAYSRFEALSR